MFQSIAAQDAVAADTQSDSAKPGEVGKSGKSEAPTNAAPYSDLVAWNSDELPELLEVRKGNQMLLGYLALVDVDNYCDVETFNDPMEATRIYRLGLRRPSVIRLHEPLKYLEENIPDLSQVVT